MKECKFCGVLEGRQDYRGKPAHINRNNLCTHCSYVLERARVRPEVLSVDDMRWFEEMCEENRQQRRRIEKAMQQAKEARRPYGGPMKRFLPVSQRRVWHCAYCDTGDESRRDAHYLKYCVTCANVIRRTRKI